MNAKTTPTQPISAARELTILMNGHHPAAMGYDDTLAAIQEGASQVFSYCLDFAQFSFIELGYRVRVVRNSPLTDQPLVVDLAELLKNTRPYTDKQIRPAHDVARLIKSGAIQFLQEITLRATYPDDQVFLEGLSEDALLRFQSWFVALEQAEEKISGADYCGQPLRISTGIRCWHDLFARGLTPEAALREDMRAE